MDKYEIVGLVGEGSFGRVFKATERETKATVALKVIRKCGRTQKELVSLRNECDIQRQLNHPNIIHMIDSFETEAEIIVVTEFCKKDLHEILSKEGYLKEEQAMGIVIDLVSALHYLHSHRVLHRDLKPQNVLLDDSGVAKLCDFGFARSMSRGTHVLTSIKGTPLYMAPELIEEHPYDHNADLWSLGCIAYEMLVGVPPFITNSILHLVRLIRCEPIKWPDFLSPVCKSFLQGLLQKDPKQRLSWPYLHQHPFLQGKVFIDENICIPVPFTCELTSSQALAKESQKQDIFMRAATQNLILLPFAAQTVEEQQRKLALERRNATTSSLQLGNRTRNQAANNSARRYSMGAISMRTCDKDQTHPCFVGRANGITGVRQYGVWNLSNTDKKLEADDLKLEKLSLEGPKCKCQPFEPAFLAAHKANDSNRQNEDEKEALKELNMSLLAQLFPNKPNLTTTPLETEEWIAFLKQSMDEVLEGDLESIREKSFISMITAPLTNPGASSEVIDYIAKFLCLPYVAEHVSRCELDQIQQVYREEKVVVSLIFAMKLLTSHLDNSGSGDSFKDVNELSEDELKAIESLSLISSYLTYADTAFLNQFCDVVSMLHLELRVQALITLRRKKIRIALNFVAVLCQILKEMPENANLVEKIFLTNQSAAHAFSIWTPESKRNIWELSGLHEGDIMLSHDEDVPRNAILDKEKIWPNGIVPYYITEDEFDKEEKDIIKGAVQEIEKETCVKFREYKEGDTGYVVVKSDADGCWSFVGHKGGGQVLNLSEKCVRHGTAVHEFLHALGLHHQQSAPNRDDFVTVNWENIESDHKHNFNKYNSSTVTDYGIGYDYDSIMHYSSHAFSKNDKETLVPKKEGAEIGQRKHLSEKDAEKIRKIYNCNKKSETSGLFGLPFFEDLLSF